MAAQVQGRLLTERAQRVHSAGSISETGGEGLVAQPYAAVLGIIVAVDSVTDQRH
jgi:hypothetical protein